MHFDPGNKFQKKKKKKTEELKNFGVLTKNI